VLSRRAFVIGTAQAIAMIAVGRRAFALGLHLEGDEKHPDPRPGIDASKVLTKDALHEKDAAEVFDQVRQIPEVIDGIRCHCGCAKQADRYSLLSCFEGDGMAQHCEICQGQARLAFRLHRLHRDLDQIRTSIDARYDKKK
jgi:hypothetical protein